ncbi:BREX-1 system adenine-specific DNA-methyltransferase PglX [Epilithonimonas tenax]
MVIFEEENTVGKIYLDYEEDSELKNQMNYLVQNETDGKSQLIDDITQLTLIDPACGSGHILVTGFEWLYKMYREQGYGAKQAVESILKNNLYGLDLDGRAMQLSRFAILLKAAQQLENAARGEGKTLLGNTLAVLPHVYAFPEDHGFVSEDIATFTNNQYVKEIYQTIDLLRQGKNIGSALKLSLPAEAISILQQQYQQWQQKSNAGTLDLEQQAIWAHLKPYVEVALVLTQQYAAVVANPPYMGQKSMNGALKDYVNMHYPMTKADLMTIFMEVIPNLTKDNFHFALINLPSWLFLSTFEKMREHYLTNYRIDSLLHMGRGIFGIDFGSVAFAIQKQSSNENSKGSYFRLHERNFQHIYFEDIEKLFLYSNGKIDYKYDFNQYRDDDGVSEIPENGTAVGKQIFYPNIPQTNFEKIPGSPIAYSLSNNLLNLLNKINVNTLSQVKRGIATSDNDRFLRFWFEVGIEKSNISNQKDGLKWFKYNKGGEFKKWYGNQEYVVNWENDGNKIINFRDSEGRQLSRPQNIEYNFKRIISYSSLTSGSLSFRIYEDFINDQAGNFLFVKNDNDFDLILSVLNSKISKYFLNIINPTLNITVDNIKIIPVLNIKELELTSIFEITKIDWDSRETSWDFEQNPLLGIRDLGIWDLGSSEKGSGMENSSLVSTNYSLKEAYQTWQEKVSKDFFQLHTNEEELNRIFIDIYGLQDELTPEVALKDITILQDELKAEDLTALEPAYRAGESVVLPIQKEVVISQLLSYLVGCMLGRYRLDKSGLHIAHPNASEEELKEYLVIGGKGLGAKSQELILNHIHYEHPEFSRSVGLAESYVVGNRSLQSQSQFSEGGIVWTHESNQTSNGISSQQYSRRTSAGNQGISSLSENSEGFASRNGYATGDSLSAELSSGNPAEESPESNHRNTENAEWINEQAKQLITNRSSLFTFTIDDDAILPLMGNACAFPDDAVKRIEDILHRIYGEDSHTQNLNFIDDALGMKLDKWMTEKFWPYHISGNVYKKKPIYWLFSSNPKKPHTAAFRVLVYMHRMDGYTVQKIMQNYLHPHQDYLKDKQQAMEKNEANLSKQELKIFENLEKQISELKAYNEVLKKLAAQQITFDLDDGVTVNYAKFDGALAVI